MFACIYICIFIYIYLEKTRSVPGTVVRNTLANQAILYDIRKLYCMFSTLHSQDEIFCREKESLFTMGEERTSRQLTACIDSLLISTVVKHLFSKFKYLLEIY